MYIPLRRQKVLTRWLYRRANQINEQMGRGLSITGRDISRALDLISCV
jgi:hypothetical protein